MIFTLFITCVLGLGALQSSCAAPRLNETQVVESKHKNNLAYDSSKAVFSIADFTSTQFLYDFIDCQYQRGGEYRNIGFGVMNSYSIVFNSGSGDTYPGIREFYGWYESNTGYDIGRIEFNKYYSGFGNNEEVGQYYSFFYTMIFYGAWGDNPERLIISYKVTSYNSIVLLPFVEVSVWMDDTEVDLDTEHFDNFSYVETSSQRLHPFLDYYTPYIQQRVDDTNYQYNRGYTIGYNDGVDYGENHPNQATYDNIYYEGRQNGYTAGYSEASADNGVPALIFSSILSVALIPVNVFIQMFQYEVFGINIAGLVSGLVTIAMVAIVIRFMVGGKTDDK